MCELALRSSCQLHVPEGKETPYRLFFDMDGVLCEYRYEDDLSTLYQKGYFAKLRANQSFVQAVKKLLEDPKYDIYVISSVLSDSKFARKEKEEWLNRLLPEIDQAHRIFPPCGPVHMDKKDAVPDGVREKDLLIDDYGKNVRSWPGKYIKVSRDARDAKKEARAHVHVVSPDSSANRIIREVENALI